LDNEEENDILAKSFLLDSIACMQLKIPQSEIQVGIFQPMK